MLAVGARSRWPAYRVGNSDLRPAVPTCRFAQRDEVRTCLLVATVRGSSLCVGRVRSTSSSPSTSRTDRTHESREVVRCERRVRAGAHRSARLGLDACSMLLLAREIRRLETVEATTLSVPDLPSKRSLEAGEGGCAPVPITESPREPAASGSHVPLADEARRPGARGSNMGSVCSRTRGPAPRCARPCLRADVDDSRRRTSPDDHATHVQCSKACASRRARSVSRYDCPTRVERLRSTHPFRANSDSVTAYGSRQRTDSAALARNAHPIPAYG